MTNVILEAAKKHIGTTEIAGLTHNPKIVRYFADVGHSWVQDDETPWCAAFVGSVLASIGIEGTNKLNARSYLDWGNPVDIDAAQDGDVIVFWRKSPSGPYGHVGFFAGWADSGNPLVLGGNQSDSVSIAEYPRGRVLAVRRAKMPRTSPTQSRIVQGSAAATGGITGSVAIEEAQKALTEAQTSLKALLPYLDTLKYLFIAVALAGAVLTMYARLKDWKRGRR
jgi:uncharacterized protein (TIGR02594 family)